MKKALLTLGLILAIATIGFCADGDIDFVEVRPPTAKIQPVSICFYVEGPQSEVIYSKKDASGNVSGGDKPVTFVNTPAVMGESCQDPVCSGDPEVCEPPVCTPVELVPENNEFNDFYAYIHTRIRAGDSLYLAIKKAVKIKLGL